MNALPEKKKDQTQMPSGLVLEKPPFVPRMVMTNQLQSVMREVVSQWRNRKAFAGLAKYGIRPLDRLLFYGPPGNGKTMACYWMSRELELPVYRVVCSQMHDSYLGGSEKKVVEVLDYLGKLSQPALCLWDEVEAIFIDRQRASGQCDNAVAAATTVMLQGLDRWASPVLNVLATNLRDKLDAALLSRTEMQLEFPGPNQEQSEQMVSYWSELLCAHGGDEWGPVLTEQVKEHLPTSFREIHQMVSRHAREWTAAKFRGKP